MLHCNNLLSAVLPHSDQQITEFVCVYSMCVCVYLNFAHHPFAWGFRIWTSRSIICPQFLESDKEPLQHISLPLYVWVSVCFRVHLWGCVCNLWKPFCPLLHANALTKALAFYAGLGQPADRKAGSNTGGGDLSDWNQTLFHLFSAMPAHTLMLHFLHTQETVSPQRGLSEWTLSASLSFSPALTDLSPIELQIKINLVMQFQFYMHFFSLM